jgi:hypothetical protein
MIYMSMPTIPKEPHRPNKEETIIDLMESIALEEIALSHILNAEAEKIQAFVGKDLNFPTCPSNSQILQFNCSVNQLFDSIVMKEWLLLRKFQNVMEFAGKGHETIKVKSCSCGPKCKCYHCKDEKKDHDKSKCRED